MSNRLRALLSDHFFYSVTFLTFNNAETSFALHDASHQAGAVIGALALKAILEVSPEASPVCHFLISSSPVLIDPHRYGFQNIIGRVTASIASFIWPPTDKPWYPLLSRLAATGKPIDQLIGNLMGLAVGASVNHGHATVNVVDFYLDAARTKERDHIVELVKYNDTDSNALLLGYVSEAMRTLKKFIPIGCTLTIYFRSQATVRRPLARSHC